MSSCFRQKRYWSLLLFLLLGWQLQAAPTLLVGTNVNLSHMTGNQSEAAIGIDPTNPNHLFAAANIASGTGLFAAYSTNGGTNWSYSDPSDGIIADGAGTLPAACCDPTVTWDGFGNLYLGYINDNLAEIDVIVSTNGGVSFTKTITLASGHGVDQPTIVAGSGAASNRLWITYRDDDAGGLVAQGAQITGLGVIGAFGAAVVIPGTPSDGSFGDIAIGPTNQVMVTYQIPTGGEGPATIFVNVDPDGSGPAAFGPAIQVTTMNVGGFDFITPQPNRSVDSEAGLAWDNNPASAHFRRVYLVYTDETPAESNNTDIYLRYSDNNGQTWSAAVKVNDDVGTNAQFMPRIAIDPTTGNIAISWHDCRNDLGTGGAGDRDGKRNNDAQFYATSSSDGGLTFSANVKVSAGTSSAIVAQNGIDYGDYTGLAFYNGNFFPIWADNSNSTGNNPNTTNRFDIYTARVSLGANTNSADVSLTMTAVPDPVLVGGNLTYTLSITNRGPLTATNVVVTNILPTNVTFVSVTNSQGSATTNGGKIVSSLGNLASNAFATVTIKVIPTNSAYITNTATVSSTTADPNSANNAASTITAVSPADLQFGSTESPDPVYIGYYETYNMRVTNAGPATATGVKLLDTLPFSATLISVSVSQGTYSVANGLLTCDLGTLASNGVASVTVVVQPMALGTIANNVGVIGNQLDPNTDNNGASPETQVIPLPPMIANVSVLARSSSAFVTWTTFSNATTQVAYGLTTNYGSISTFDARLVANHIVWLTGLQPDTTYYFQVISRIGSQVFTDTGSFFTTSSLIVDNPDATYSGNWTIGLGSPDRFGEYYQYAATVTGFPTSEAFYAPEFPSPGKYDVSIWYPQGPNRTTNAQIFISSSNDAVLASVDQTSNGGKWNLLASGMDFDAGMSGFVAIQNNTGENNKIVVADAVRWNQNLAAESPTDGTLPLWWTDFYFGTNVSGAVDSDLDGYSNYQEFVLGTEPNDASSHLNFRIERAQPGGLRLVFAPFQNGRLYGLEAASVVTGPFTAITTPSPIANANGEGTLTFPSTPGSALFYRLTAQVTP